MVENFADPMWRLCNLYYIIDKSNKRVKFSPNAEQRDFIENLWYRNTILKVRQLGFSTLIQLIILDAAVFTANTRCAVIAQTLKIAGEIFKGKIKFAYDNLPEQIKAKVYPVTDSKTELELSNGSIVTVGTTARGGTLQYLHVSEFGKICATRPDHAEEIVTGAIEAVSPDGFLFIESTAEGRSGYFYDYCQEDQKRIGQKLDKLDRRFHFYSWFNRAEYEADPATVAISPADHKYFDNLEAELGITISLSKRAWYCKKKESMPDKVKREYPSTPKEAFEQSSEGAYYREQFITLRKQSRICAVPHVRGVVVNTFWDLGANDLNAIWFHQQVGPEHRFIHYYENSGETLDHYVMEMQKLGFLWGRHFLPHDAAAKRLGMGMQNKSPEMMLQELGLYNTVVIPRCDSVTTAINQTRILLPQCWFDEERCKEGLVHLEAYSKEWDAKAGTWRDRPKHDPHSNGSDAFRQFAQANDLGLLFDNSAMFAAQSNYPTGDSYTGY